MMKILLPALLSFLIAIPLSAQNRSAKNDFYDALYFYEEEKDYEEAAYLFKQVLDHEPENSHVRFLLGMCYNNILGQEQLGIPYFLEAADNINLRYKANKFALYNKRDCN